MSLTYNQKQMVYWIEERESIRLKKEAGLPAPWSSNAVMQTTYFCNVNREDDKVTRWILDNWKYDKCPEHFTLAIIVARIFNLPNTLSMLSQPIHLESWFKHAEKLLSEMSLDGDKIWNGAYIVSTNGQKIDKIS